MKTCYKCKQPITNGSTAVNHKDGRSYHHSTEVQSYYGAGGLGCPVVDHQVAANLKIAVSQGYEMTTTDYEDVGKVKRARARKSKDFTRSRNGKSIMTTTDYEDVGKAYHHWRQRKGFVIQAHSADLKSAITNAWQCLFG